jgi:hypothetical protein
MGTERSHGKARTVLATSGMLRAIDTEASEARRAHNRDDKGRFRPGNKVATERGTSTAIKRLFGGLARQEDLGPDAQLVVGDARRLYLTTMRSMPVDAAIVRSKVASMAWHEAMAAHWRRRALLAGLDTPEGIGCDERATQHDVRAERLVVTALDLAQRLPKPAPPIPSWWTAPTAPAPQTREPDSSAREDGPQDADEGEDDADDLDEPLARLRAVQGQRGASDDDEDDGGTR